MYSTVKLDTFWPGKVRSTKHLHTASVSPCPPQVARQSPAAFLGVNTSEVEKILKARGPCMPKWMC